MFISGSRKFTFIVLATLVTLLILLFWKALGQLEQDRIQLIRRFSEERFTSLETATQDVEDDIQDISDDLLFVARLLRSEPVSQNRKSIVEILLGANKAYHSAALYQCDETMPLVVTDPHRRGALSPEIRRLMEETAESAMSTEDFETQVSPLIKVEDNTIRVFAIKLDGQGQCRIGRAFALAVNTGMFLEKLHLVTSDKDTHLLVLGPQGLPTPLSSDVLEKALLNPSQPENSNFSTFNQLIKSMRAGQRGIATIDGQEAKKLGLGSGDVIAVYLPMRADAKTHWDVATFTSIAALRSHERKIVVRLALMSLITALSLTAIGAYILVSSRKRAVLQERVRHFDEVARLNEKAKKTLDSIPIGVLTMSSDLRVTDMNHALSLQSGVTLRGMSLGDTFTLAKNSSVDRLNSLVHRVLSSGEKASILGAKLSLFGEEGYFSVHAVAIDPSSEHMSLLLVFEDLSEVKSLENQLLAAEKLTTVGILAAGIAHEIGTPLCVVRGRAEYLMDKLGEDSPHVAGLEIMVEQIDRVSRIIRGLLDFSRSKPVAITPVEVGPLLHKCADLLLYEASRRQVQLEIRLSEPLPFAAADGDQMQQVMINLIMNALDASLPNEKVIVSVSTKKIGDSLSKESLLKIEVKDNGSGIPEENIHRVFDPFFTTKKRGQGTGLGLAIVSDIIRNHNARIDIDSTQGQGTRVILGWPIAG